MDVDLQKYELHKLRVLALEIITSNVLFQIISKTKDSIVIRIIHG